MRHANGLKWKRVWKTLRDSGRKKREQRKDFNLTLAILFEKNDPCLCMWDELPPLVTFAFPFCSCSHAQHSHKLLLSKRKLIQGRHCAVAFACFDVSRSPRIWILTTWGFREYLALPSWLIEKINIFSVYLFKDLFEVAQQLFPNETCQRNFLCFLFDSTSV